MYVWLIVAALLTAVAAAATNAAGVGPMHANTWYDLVSKLFSCSYRSESSVAEPGCLSRSRIRTVSIPDPGSRIRIKEFKYFNPKKNKKMVSKL